jgi:hypothetical protein
LVLGGNFGDLIAAMDPTRSTSPLCRGHTEIGGVVPATAALWPLTSRPHRSKR